MFFHSGASEGTETAMIIDFEQNLGFAVLVNAGSYGFGPSLTSGAIYGSADIVMGKEPGSYKSTRNTIIYWSLFIVAAVILVLIIRQIIAIINKKITKSNFGNTFLPLIIALIVSWLFLHYIPRAFGEAPLATAIIYTPDVSWMLIVNSILISIWAIAKSWSGYRARFN